jgi:predicted amidophosphoribosyltransferase
MIRAGIGFRSFDEVDRFGSRLTQRLFVPHWLIVVLSMVLPAAQLMRWRRRRRTRAGPTACPTCGYDCRATPERCPECGCAVTNEASQ